MRKAARRLLLVGCGHAQLELLRRLGEARLPDVELTVVSPSGEHPYSGMVPGFLGGSCRRDEVVVPLGPLVERAGGRLVLGTARRLEPRAQRIEIQQGAVSIELGYDLVSLAVGSTTARGEEVGGEPFAAKPIGHLLELPEHLQRIEKAVIGRAARIVVVGGGAAGVEIALCLATPQRQIELVEGGKTLLPSYPPRVGRRLDGILRARGIGVQIGSAVTSAAANGVRLADGTWVAAEVVLWLTGAVGWPFLRDSGLPVDGRGFLLTDDCLRSIADPRILCSGDCGTLAAHPLTPKAGVYAVREGPVLWRSVLAALQRQPPRAYRPQRRFLSLMNTGDGKALLSGYGLFGYGRWVWRLKDRIDRSFVRRYQRAGRAPD